MESERCTEGLSGVSPEDVAGRASRQLRVRGFLSQCVMSWERRRLMGDVTVPVDKNPE